mmetsp:Transcript_67473/g.161380  ORF Transcript_67473/g.161380 Transcript_67473/m.161380 type:complete len:126 (-) Transcript_67473:129-506(-)
MMQEEIEHEQLILDNIQKMQDDGMDYVDRLAVALHDLHSLFQRDMQAMKDTQGDTFRTKSTSSLDNGASAELERENARLKQALAAAGKGDAVAQAERIAALEERLMRTEQERDDARRAAKVTFSV